MGSILNVSEWGCETQIQTEIGEGHANLVDVHQLLLTPTHLALCMDYASGGSLTSYVADKWEHADPSGLVMSEDEARYFFKVSVPERQIKLVSLLTAQH